MSCEQIDAEMIDFLYGELPAAERAAFEAHVAGCARCRSEVDAFGKTRTLARAALDEAPPARVHDAVMRAAREAAAGAAAGAAAAPAAAPPAKASLAPAVRASFWDWLRARWALPTLATVGALTAFLLGIRLFMNPHATYERGRSMVEPPPEPAEVVAPAAPAAPLRAAEAPPADETKAARAEAKAGAGSARPAASHRRAAARAGAGAGAVGQKGEGGGSLPPAELFERNDARARDELLGGSVGGRLRATPPARAKSVMGDDDPLDGLKAPAGEAAEKRSAKSAESGKSAESASREAERSFAQPPPAREPIADRAPVAAKDDAARTTPFGANAGRVSAPSPAKKKSAPSAPSARPEPDDEMPLRKEVDKRVVDDDASPSSSSAARNQAAAAPRAFAPPPPPASPRGAGPPPAPAAAPAPAPSVARPMVATAPSAARVKSESAADSEEAPAPRETLVQRADRLFTQGRWAEAAIAYRDLLRQRPNAPEASQWRKRLAASRAAIATGRPPSSR